MQVTKEGTIRALSITAAVVIVIGVVLWMRCGVRGCPDVDLVAGFSPEEASVIVDRDGEELAKLYLVQRTVVPLDSLPEYVGEAFVAIEDQRFWSHDGVDWLRIPGALWANLKAGGVEEGFSTITMQLARNIFPNKLPATERTIWRKLGEMRVAGEIEERYSKEEILSMYLNQIYFGNGAWGIEAAAREYFGKPASELTLEEAALLAGVPVAPSRNNPRASPDLARERRNLVLERMAEQELITEAEAEAAQQAEIELARSGDRGSAAAPYFVETVRQVLEQQLGNMIYTEGLTVYTTLDADIQAIAERELIQQLDAIEAGRYGVYRHPTYDPDGGESVESGQTGYLQGGVVFMETATGNVLALVGGRDFSQSKYNRATQAKRQPGSAFKPFVYATAIARGYPPTFPLDDTPLRMEIDGRVWTPENYGNSYSGRITLHEALVHSKNVATVRLAERVGLGSVIETAHSIGYDEEIPEYPSIALGTVEVPLIELTAAYGAFATLGERTEPRFVTRVEDRDGTIVWQEPVESRQVLDPAVAFILTTMLQDVVNRGTATAVRASGYRSTVAGKTGTTNDGSDAWFIGYTPSIVGGVWIGLDDPQTIVRGATGGGLAAPVWARIAGTLDPGQGGWVPPPGVEVRQVDAAGRVLVEGCPATGEVRKEYFLSGTVAAATTCFSDYAMGYDTMYGDYYDYDAYMDSIGAETDSWFDRLRERLFGDEPRALPPDDPRYGESRPAPADTLELGELPENPQAQRLGESEVPPLEGTVPPRPVQPAPRPVRPPPQAEPPPAPPDTGLLGDPVPPDTSAASTGPTR
ncbi:MAG: transglycosylase domain-containing protein [Longimicrobiales bacterium]